ncbi:hypothetical protein ACFSTI_10285 [Rhizorhabdus histidinilytica]
MSLSPLGWPRDVYESFSGSDLLSGEPLDTFGYTAAVFGAITFGGGKPVMKAIDFVRGLTVIGHHVDDVARIVDAAHAIDQGSSPTPPPMRSCASTRHARARGSSPTTCSRTR